MFNNLTDMNAKSKKLLDVTSNSYLLNHPLSIAISLETKQSILLLARSSNFIMGRQGRGGGGLL